MKTIIFDVDGTIADCDHRRHFVEDNNDWKSFKAETVNDTPVQWVCDIAKRFIAQGDDVAFFSARNESEREITEQQISEWIGGGHKGGILGYGGRHGVIENLNTEYNELGFVFEETKLTGLVPGTYGNALDIVWTNPFNKNETKRYSESFTHDKYHKLQQYDNLWDAWDEGASSEIVKWMKEMTRKVMDKKKSSVKVYKAPK